MIPIDDAKALAEARGLRQVIIFGWDGDQTYIATYGEAPADSAAAANGANVIKKQWGWPENTIVESEKIQKLQARLKELESIADDYYDSKKRIKDLERIAEYYDHGRRR